MKRNIEDMTDYQLHHTVKQIEASPSSHRSWKVQQMVDENLAKLYAEARRRNLGWAR